MAHRLEKERIATLRRGGNSDTSPYRDDALAGKHLLTRRACWLRGYTQVVPGQQALRCCSSMRAYQTGAATSIEATGQSGQSKFHSVGEHRPGRPATAEPDNLDVRRACATAGPGAAWLGTGGEVGPGMDVKPVRATAAGGPDRTRMAGSTKRWTGATCTASITCVH